MIILRALEEITKARLPPHLEPFVLQQLQWFRSSYTSYTPADDGHVALCSPSDTDERLCKSLGRSWEENCFEGIAYDAEHQAWLVLILNNNQFCVSLIIPDEPWLDVGIRTRLKHLTEGGGCDR